MPWVKFDDGFDDSEDIDSMSCEAIALNLCGTTWSSRNLTDGFIPDARVRKLPGGHSESAIAELCFGPKPWWIKTDGGYQIRSFLKYNPSGEEVKERRAEISQARSEAGKKGAANRWQERQTDGKPYGNDDGKTDGLPVVSDGKPMAPSPVSRLPESGDPNPQIGAENRAGLGDSNSDAPKLKVSKSEFILALLPESHQTEELRLALVTYLKLRSANRWASWKEVTMTANAKDWSEWTASEVTQALQNSVRNAWQSVHRPAAQKQKPGESPDQFKTRMMGEKVA